MAAPKRVSLGAPGVDHLGRPVTHFVDALNCQLVAAVKPRLVVIPVSVANNADLRRLDPNFGLLVDSLEQREELRLPTEGKATMRCYSGIVRRGDARIAALVLPHPSAWRCRSEARRVLIDDVSFMVRRAVQGEADVNSDGR